MRSFLAPSKEKIAIAMIIALMIYISIWASHTLERSIWYTERPGMTKEVMIELANIYESIEFVESEPEIRLMTEVERSEVNRALVLERGANFFIGIVGGYLAACIIVRRRRKA